MYKKREGLLSRKIGNELMIYDKEKDKVHVLNETGSIIWGLLDGKNNIQDIENILKEKFNDIPIDTISKDTAEIIKKLDEEGLIKNER